MTNIIYLTVVLFAMPFTGGPNQHAEIHQATKFRTIAACIDSRDIANAFRAAQEKWTEDHPSSAWLAQAQAQCDVEPGVGDWSNAWVD
jgi:hypothetical protein